MTYDFHGKAQDEASGHPAPADRIEQLRELCRTKASRLGAAGYRASRPGPGAPARGRRAGAR